MNSTEVYIRTVELATALGVATTFCIALYYLFIYRP